MRYENLSSKEILIQLWAHESSRVFHDRLVNEKDREWYIDLLNSHITKVFEFEWERS